MQGLASRLSPSACVPLAQSHLTACFIARETTSELTARGFQLQINRIYSIYLLACLFGLACWAS